MQVNIHSIKMNIKQTANSILCAPLLLACITTVITLSMTSCQESKPERFERESREYTERKCPQRVTPDGSVVLDSLVYHKECPDDIIYYYSVDATDDVVVKLQMQKEELRKQLLSSINSSVDLKNIKAAGLTIIYLYRNKATQQELLKFSFTKNDYKPVL